MAGKCTHVEGECVATLRADCLASDQCRKVGQCSARDGECVARCDADCRASELCRDLGPDLDCYPSTEEGTCVVY